MGATYHAWGHSTIVNPNGEVISRAETEEQVVSLLSSIQMYTDHSDLRRLLTRDTGRDEARHPRRQPEALRGLFAGRGKVRRDLLKCDPMIDHKKLSA